LLQEGIGQTCQVRQQLSPKTVDILSADIGNAYLNLPMKEHMHTTTGLEFGPNHVGQTVVIV
jgi:hypothetical protein